MDADIEFLRNFIEYDRYRIDELNKMNNDISYMMRMVGCLLRNHAPGPITIPYHNENDIKYEFLQLLDGNNFEVEYGFTLIGSFYIAKLTPLYPQIIEKQQELDYHATTTDILNKITIGSALEIHRGLRANTLLIDDNLTIDGKSIKISIQPP